MFHCAFVSLMMMMMLMIIIILLLTILTPVVRGQLQADALKFHLSNALGLVPHNMLLHK